MGRCAVQGQTGSLSGSVLGCHAPAATAMLGWKRPRPRVRLTAGEGAAGQLGEGAAGSSGGVNSHLTSCGRRAGGSSTNSNRDIAHDLAPCIHMPAWAAWHGRIPCSCCSRLPAKC